MVSFLNSLPHSPAIPVVIQTIPVISFAQIQSQQIHSSIGGTASIPQIRVIWCEPSQNLSNICSDGGGRSAIIAQFIAENQMEIQQQHEHREQHFDFQNIYYRKNVENQNFTQKTREIFAGCWMLMDNRATAILRST